MSAHNQSLYCLNIVGRDEIEAIDEDNIIKSRLRDNKPKKGALREPDDRELGLVEDEMEK